MTIQGRSCLLLTVLTVLIALVVAPAVYADDDDDDGGGSNGNRCVVKFVCGEVADVEGGEEDAARAVFGSYRTTINVANTGTSTRPITYTKKLLTTTPCDEEVDTFETPGEVSSTINGSLGMMSAFDIDCREIFEEFDTCGDFAEGFLVLQSSGPLSVTAVYTAGDTTGDGASSIDVESVKCGSGGGGDDDDD